ncbi:MAG: thiaminase II [Pseudomonadota bacterium]
MEDGSVGTTFSAQAWAKNAELYEKTRTLPFNEELAAGTLSHERFKYYMIQDAHYLIGYARALAIVAAKATEADGVEEFTKAANNAIVVERALHSSFLADWGISPSGFAQTPVAPTTDHYVSFLLATTYGDCYEVGLAAVLPCFWVYAEVGKDIFARAAPSNPFQAWIDTYAGEDFQGAVRRAIDATDQAAAAASPAVIERMHAAFTRSCQLEWMFWDSAYRTLLWPV